jgi:hypothetical protein
MDEGKFRLIAGSIVTGVVTIFSIAIFSLILWRDYKEGVWYEVAKQHFAAVIGLPMAAVASLFVVLVLRISSGPIEFEGASFKFKGAAAPIVFWLFCFLGIAAAIKLLW